MPYIIGPGVFHHTDVLHYKGDLPVVQHFNGPGQWIEDMHVAVAKSGLQNRDVRQHEEMRHI